MMRPLPSSPHWPPTTTTTDICCSSGPAPDLLPRLLARLSPGSAPHSFHAGGAFPNKPGGSIAERPWQRNSFQRPEGRCYVAAGLPSSWRSAGRRLRARGHQSLAGGHRRWGDGVHDPHYLGSHLSAGAAADAESVVDLVAAVLLSDSGGRADLLRPGPPPPR